MKDSQIIKSTDEMQKFIYEKIKNMKNTNELYDFAQLNHIPGTVNNNGIFINLTALSEDYIQMLYEKTKYYSQLKHTDLNDYLDKSYSIPEKTPETKVVFKKPEKKKCKGKNCKFTSLETTILSYAQ